MVFQRRLQSLLGSDSNREAQTTLEISNSSLQKHNATSAFRETRRHGLNAEGTSQRSDPKNRRLCGAETLASHRSAGNRPYPGCCSPSLGEHSLSTLLWGCRPLSGPAAERGKVSGAAGTEGHAETRHGPRDPHPASLKGVLHVLAGRWFLDTHLASSGNQLFRWATGNLSLPLSGYVGAEGGNSASPNWELPAPSGSPTDFA